jgi:hypothetical protein
MWSCLHKAIFICIKQVRVEARLLRTFKRGKKAITLIIETATKSSSHIHQINISWTYPLGSPPRNPRGSNPIHTLFLKFYDEVKVLYDQASVSKSSITVDMAFRKDLTLQGCTTLPTCDDHLHSHMTSFRETLAEWWSPTTFTSHRPIPWATPKGSIRHYKMAILQHGTVCCESRLVYQRNPPQSTLATSLYDAPLPPSRFTFDTYAKWKAQTR